MPDEGSAENVELRGNNDGNFSDDAKVRSGYRCECNMKVMEK